MFHPVDHPMERGWPGRVEADHVVQLAAQTLQSFFTGGGSAREHAAFPLEGVRFLAPVLHPPAVRVFEDESTFAFGNPAAIVHPGSEVRPDNACNSLLQGGLLVLPRVAAVIGVDGALGGYTLLAEWRDPSRAAPKDRDFALGLGPVVVTETPDVELVVRAGGSELLRARDGFDWQRARDLAADRTRLYPGDLLAGPALGEVEVSPGDVAIEAAGIGVLEQRIAG
jgi:hypothetical protein